MRYWFLNLLFFTIFISCSVDDLPGCEGSGNPYEICREYQYINGDYNGVNNYFYDDSGSVLISKSTLSASGRKEGFVFYNYNSLGFLSSIEYVNGLSDLVRLISYKYDLDGVLIEENNSIDFNQKKNYNYINGVLYRVVYSEDKLIEIIKEDGQGNVFERLVYQRF